MTLRPDDDGPTCPEAPFRSDDDDVHMRGIAVEHCGHGWARVVVCLPSEATSGLTLLAASDALGMAALAEGVTVDDEGLPVVGFGASPSAVGAGADSLAFGPDDLLH